MTRYQRAWQTKRERYGPSGRDPVETREERAVRLVEERTFANLVSRYGQPRALRIMDRTCAEALTDLAAWRALGSI